MNKTYWYLSQGLAIAGLLLAIAVYPWLPERVPIHWNIHGEVDGYGSRLWAFATPAMMAAMLLLFRALPYLSPRGYKIDAFRPTYDYLVFVLTVMFAYVHILLVLAFLDIFVHNSRALVAGLYLGFAALGRVLPQVRRNYYVGIRTPWTLSSERVWDETHRLGGWTFLIAGITGALVALIPVLPLWLPIALLAPAALGPVLFSLVRYKYLERRGGV